MQQLCWGETEPRLISAAQTPDNVFMLAKTSTSGDRLVRVWRETNVSGRELILIGVVRVLLAFPRSVLVSRPLFKCLGLISGIKGILVMSRARVDSAY